MKTVTLSVLSLLSLMLTGCLTAPVIPPGGAVFTSWTAPLDTDINLTEIQNMNEGRASTYAVLGLVAFGNGGVKEAAGDGSISVIHHVDYEYMNVLFGAFQRYTTIAYGR